VEGGDNDVIFSITWTYGQSNLTQYSRHVCRDSKWTSPEYTLQSATTDLHDNTWICTYCLHVYAFCNDNGV